MISSLTIGYKLESVREAVRRLTFTAKYTKNGNPTFSAAAGAHDDLIMALTLACYFFENRRGLPRVHATVVGTTRNRISSQFDLERFLQDRMLYR